MKQIILDLTKEYQAIEISEDTEVIGLFVGKSDRKLVSSLDIIHKKPNLTSLTKIKAVVFDKSRFDMTGNLIIETGARNTDAYLRIDVLLMDKTASARAVPSLEITEDSVKGGHGATVGQVDQEQLFYLQARGLNKKEAENTLVDGFISDVINMANTEEKKKILLKNI